MALEDELTNRLTQAIKDKDGRTADVVQIDDALVLDVIGAYRKQLQKAIAEYDKLGERGAEEAARLRFEQEFCESYLPKGMEEAAVRALVKERLAALGITEAKQVGRLVGDIMKTHKGQVEAGDVKRIAEELLKG